MPTESARNPILIRRCALLTTPSHFKPDGALLVGGIFRLSGSLADQRLVRLRPDGQLDSGFRAPPLDNSNPLFALQPDGKILVGGSMATVDGVPHGPVFRLNADGSLEEDFPAAAIRGAVFALAMQVDGRILVAGDIGVQTNWPRALVRLEANGAFDAGFVSPEVRHPEYQGVIHCLAVQGDGCILIGLDASGGPGTPPGDIIARLLPDGSVDSSYQPNSVESTSGCHVGTLALQANGQILIGGYLPRKGDFPQDGIAKLNGDGAPTISNGPASQGFLPGDRTSFSVTATGTEQRKEAWFFPSGPGDGRYPLTPGLPRTFHPPSTGGHTTDPATHIAPAALPDCRHGGTRRSRDAARSRISAIRANRGRLGCRS